MANSCIKTCTFFIKPSLLIAYKFKSLPFPSLLKASFLSCPFFIPLQQSIPIQIQNKVCSNMIPISLLLNSDLSLTQRANLLLTEPVLYALAVKPVPTGLQLSYHLALLHPANANRTLVLLRILQHERWQFLQYFGRQAATDASDFLLQFQQLFIGHLVGIYIVLILCLEPHRDEQIRKVVGLVIHPMLDHLLRLLIPLPNIEDPLLEADQQLLVLSTLHLHATLFLNRLLLLLLQFLDLLTYPIKYLLDLPFLFIIFTLVFVVSMQEVGIGLRTKNRLIDGIINHEFFLSFGVCMTMGVLVKEGPYGYFQNQYSGVNIPNYSGCFTTPLRCTLRMLNVGQSEWKQHVPFFGCILLLTQKIIISRRNKRGFWAARTGNKGFLVGNDNQNYLEYSGKPYMIKWKRLSQLERSITNRRPLSLPLKLLHKKL